MDDRFNCLNSHHYSSDFLPVWPDLFGLDRVVQNDVCFDLRHTFLYLLGSEEGNTHPLVTCRLNYLNYLNDSAPVLSILKFHNSRLQKHD